MKRVLLMVRKLWNGGGTETYVFTLAKTLQKHGHVVAIYTSGGPWVSYFRNHGITVHVAPRYKRSKNQLKKIIRKKNYQYIHANDGHSISLVSKLEPRPFHVITTIHGKYIPPKIVNIAGKISSSVIAVSASMRNYAIKCGVHPSKVTVVFNGVSSRFYRGYDSRGLYGSDKRFVIGYAGRYTFDKKRLGLRIAQILRFYQTRNRQIGILIAGRGSNLLLKRRSNFLVLGQVNNMRKFYRSCDVIIGTGRVALEAMACGIPVIAVGHYKFIGYLTPQNLNDAVLSNFGDHGKRRIFWRKSRLLRQLHHISNLSNKTRMVNAAKLRKIARRRFSAETMVRRIVNEYH